MTMDTIKYFPQIDDLWPMIHDLWVFENILLFDSNKYNYCIIYMAYIHDYFIILWYIA